MSDPIKAIGDSIIEHVMKGISELNISTPKEKKESDLMTTSEVAKVLLASESTVRTLTRKGELMAYTLVGKTHVYKRKEVMNFLESNLKKVETAKEFDERQRANLST